MNRSTCITLSEIHTNGDDEGEQILLERNVLFSWIMEKFVTSDWLPSIFMGDGKSTFFFLCWRHSTVRWN